MVEEAEPVPVRIGTCLDKKLKLRLLNGKLEAGASRAL